jgi:hypothetical protein
MASVPPQSGSCLLPAVPIEVLRQICSYIFTGSWIDIWDEVEEEPGKEGSPHRRRTKERDTLIKVRIASRSGFYRRMSLMMTCKALYGQLQIYLAESMHLIYRVRRSAEQVLIPDAIKSVHLPLIKSIEIDGTSNFDPARFPRLKQLHWSDDYSEHSLDFDFYHYRTDYELNEEDHTNPTICFLPHVRGDLDGQYVKDWKKKWFNDGTEPANDLTPAMKLWRKLRDDGHRNFILTADLRINIQLNGDDTLD